ncbi:RNA-directed DNA polymerase [Microbacterium sp.]|uniref:RNA-directed DNA polymerase n=1 Tax=Microbacterium sp. TaxID=51671 RepID=UPI0028B1B51E|nr:RNA-directed DNA polymerase [Microbacterium sp.]
MKIDKGLLARLNLEAAAEIELAKSNRLMPSRPDRQTLVGRGSEVEKTLRNGYVKGHFGDRADVVFVDKNRRGRRPISEMTLRDRVLYRALVTLIAESLPMHLVNRIPNAEFKTRPLDVDGVRYISKTDVVAYYEFIDHGRLADELEAQTGEAPAIDVLMELLFRIMGRRVGLPQVHQASDILGDTYIDPVRRRMVRAGYAVTTYSDDFRIATKTLGEARLGLEDCAREVRALGLTLNEGKTFTFTVKSYRTSLAAFGEAERQLFENGDAGDVGLLFLDDYPDESPTATSTGAPALADTEAQAVTDEDALDSHDGASAEISEAQEKAAIKAWKIWLHEEETEEQQSKPEAAITESLLGRALPILGRAGRDVAVGSLSHLLRYEPTLTPQIAKYITELGTTSPQARKKLRAALNGLVDAAILSNWQKIWLASAAGALGTARGKLDHYHWLMKCVDEADPALAATAAAALGQLKYGDVEAMKAALDRVGPVWRTLVLWGIAQMDTATAEAVADDLLERKLLGEAQP